MATSLFDDWSQPDRSQRIARPQLAVQTVREYLADGTRPIELFDEAEVNFYWDVEPHPSRKVVNLLCVPKEAFIKHFDPHVFVCSWGRDCSGWPGSNGFNAAGLFGQFNAGEDLSALERLELLLEFCRIRECEWARQMLLGYLRNHQLTDEDGDVWVKEIRSQSDVEEYRWRLVAEFERLDDLTETEEQT